MAEIFDKLFSNMDDFIKHMRENDNAKTRVILLRTDKLRFYYCALVCARQSVFRAVSADYQLNGIPICNTIYFKRLVTAFGGSVNFVNVAGARVMVVRDGSEGR